MKPHTFLKNLRSARTSNTAARRRIRMLGAAGLLPAAALAADKDVVFKGELTVRESYDSNVYIQDAVPSSYVPGAVQPQQGSFVTSATPRVGLDFKRWPEFAVSVAYAPEVVRYHSEPSENYVAHRANLNFTGKTGDVTWEQLNAFTWLDGNKLGPTFVAPGDVPAVGGIPLRDRRAALVYRDSLKLTYALGQWFVRPVASAYVHDFRIEQRTSPGAPTVVYENAIDRKDVNGGLDVGYKVGEKTHLVAGYRYGYQEQGILLGNPSPYCSKYHRPLIGIEGTPTSWLKLAVLAGPDIRDFSGNVPAAFNKDELLYWIDATATLTPTGLDTVTLSVKRYEQPAFSSHSVYEDVTYDLSWKHKLNDKLTLGAGFRAYLGDWQAPVNREDWIYTPSGSLTCAFTKKFSGELFYSYDWVESKVPAKPGREFTRHIGGVGLKYVF